MSREELERLRAAEAELSRENQRLMRCLIGQLDRQAARRESLIQILVSLIRHVELVAAKDGSHDTTLMLTGLREAVILVRMELWASDDDPEEPIAES